MLKLRTIVFAIKKRPWSFDLLFAGDNRYLKDTKISKALEYYQVDGSNYFLKRI